jgi:hypothetical protein
VNRVGPILRGSSGKLSPKADLQPATLLVVNSPEPPSLPGWADYFVAGRMPLWFATIFGLLGSIGATLVLNDMDLGTVAGIPTIFVLFVLPPACAVPFVAKHKRRSVVRWTPVGVAALAVSAYVAFLPLMTVLALTFAARPRVKIPQATLEADEDPRPLQTLFGIREEVGALHAYVEELYGSRDYRGIADQRANAEAIARRIERVPLQISDRGQRARLHMNAGAMQLLNVTGAADYVARTIAEKPFLDPIARGDETKIKRKLEKALHKEVREVEILLDRSRIQVATTKGLLEELGVTVPRQVEVSAPALPPLASAPPAEGPSVKPQRPRRRPPRRHRF